MILFVTITNKKNKSNRKRMIKKVSAWRSSLLPLKDRKIPIFPWTELKNKISYFTAPF
jgi:hypothetical protein